MVLTREELLNSVRSSLSDDTSDEAIALVENISDTLTELENNAQVDWKKKYEDNDASWRQRYKDRFFSSGDNNDDPPEPSEPTKKLTYEDLFKED